MGWVICLLVEVCVVIVVVMVGCWISCCGVWFGSECCYFVLVFWLGRVEFCLCFGWVYMVDWGWIFCCCRGLVCWLVDLILLVLGVVSCLVVGVLIVWESVVILFVWFVDIRWYSSWLWNVLGILLCSLLCVCSFFCFCRMDWLVWVYVVVVVVVVFWYFWSCYWWRLLCVVLYCGNCGVVYWFLLCVFWIGVYDFVCVLIVMWCMVNLGRSVVCCCCLVCGFYLYSCWVFLVGFFCFIVGWCWYWILMFLLYNCCVVSICWCLCVYWCISMICFFCLGSVVVGWWWCVWVCLCGCLCENCDDNWVWLVVWNEGWIDESGWLCVVVRLCVDVVVYCMWVVLFVCVVDYCFDVLFYIWC